MRKNEGGTKKNRAHLKRILHAGIGTGEEEQTLNWRGNLWILKTG